MKTAALYIRVSTEEQVRHGFSVDNQIDSLVEYCKNNNLQYKIYNDAGISGHAAYRKRPALLQLINDCRNDKISIILFTRLDRWFRSVKDYYLVQDQIGNVPWKAIWEDYDTETSSGQLKVNIMLSVAEAEAARTSEKIKSVFEWKKANGEWHGGIPFGFKVENRKLVVDNEKTDLVKKAFNCYLSTLSTEKTRKLLMNEGNVEFATSTTRKMLCKEIYIGTHITKEQHDHILKSMQKHIRKGNRKTYIFSSLLPCPNCGHIMSSGTTSTSKGYRCHNNRCVKFHMSERKIEKVCLEALSEKLDKESITVDIKPKKAASDGRKKINDKISRLKELYVEGDISKEDYLRRKEEYEEQLNLIPSPEVKPLPKLPDGWKETYSELSIENKQAFWRNVCSSIILTPDKELDHFIFL